MPGGFFEVGPFRVTPYEMTHIGVPSLGYRIEADGKVLAYTGDTGPCDEAVKLAEDADLFLCEATYQNDSELTFFHLSSLQAAEHAAAGGAARLVLTHITPNLDPGVSLEQAAVGYDRSIDVAVPDMVIEVGACPVPTDGTPRRFGRSRTRWGTRSGPRARSCCRWARPACSAPHPSRTTRRD